MVARLHPIKGHELAFESVKELSSQGYNRVKLLLIGDGPIETELKQKVEQLELSEEIKFLGYKKDVHSYLSLSDVKLLASYSESFPLVILESARAETPVISTDVGGVKDLISDDRFGWVVPVGEAEGITMAIKEAIEDKKKGTLKDKAIHLKDRAVKDYSLQRLYNDTYSTYVKIKGDI